MLQNIAIGLKPQKEERIQLLFEVPPFNTWADLDHAGDMSDMDALRERNAQNMVAPLNKGEQEPVEIADLENYIVRSWTAL